MAKIGLPLSKIFVDEQSSSFFIQAALFSLVAENRGMSLTLQNIKRHDYNCKWELKSGLVMFARQQHCVDILLTSFKFLIVLNLSTYFCNYFSRSSNVL